MNSFKLPHKSAPPELRQTYFAIYGLSVLVGLIILINIFGNFSLRSDRALVNTINDQQSAIETYARSHKKLPLIIADAGVKDTKGVDYKKISNNRYLLCATFKTKSDGFTPIAEPGIIQNQTDLGLASNTKFSDGDSGGMQHDKGYTCLTYTSYSIVSPISPPIPAQTYVTVRCGNSTSRFAKRLSASVALVDPTVSKLNLTTTGQYVYDGNNNTYLSPQSLNSTAAPIAFVSYYQYTKFYDTSCNPITADNLKVGDNVYIYLYAGNVNSETQTTWVEIAPPKTGAIIQPLPCSSASASTCLNTQ